MLTIKEAANYADKSESWVRKKILSGEISAQKNKFKFGKRWETTKKDIDDFLEQAKIEKDIVEVRDIENPISKEKFLKDLSKTVKNHNEQLLEDREKMITYQEKTILKALEKQNERSLNVIKDLIRNEVNKAFKNQNELIIELKNELKKEREEKRNKNGLLSKIKNFLFS